MHRPTVGIIALVLLTAGIALHTQALQGYVNEAVHGACLRIGAVMGAIWLALPQVSRLPAWFLTLSTAVMLLAAIRPKWILILLPMLVVFWLLRPRERRK